MAQPAHLAKARAIEHLASDLHNLSFDVAEPSRSIARSDSMTAEGERLSAAIHTIADEVRALFRGR